MSEHTNDRVRYTCQNIISNSFYQFPRFLLDAEFAGLSNDAKVLYMLLRNRHEISIKNEWFDEKGEVFIYFKREDMQNLLHLSENTIAKAMKDLKGHNLIEEERQGFAKPNKIYLLSAVQPLGIEASEPITAKFEVMDEMQESQHSRKIYGTETSTFTAHEPQNLRASYNKEIHNNIKSPVMSSQSESDGQDGTGDAAHAIKTHTEYIKNGIGYDDLAVTKPNDMELVNEFVAIILDAVLTKGNYVRIGDEDKPRELVKHNLLRLNYSDIEYAINQLKGATKRITKKKQYILTMLYNCKHELNSHYMNAVRSDVLEGGVFV